MALMIHALVLRFIFPGYYSPLYPYHSDFYIPIALSHSPSDFFQYRYLGHSRPLGIFFLKLIGFLGIHGEMVFTIVNVIANVSLSAIIVLHVLGFKFNWKFILLFCVYCYLLFSQSYFYTFYTQDVLAHLSYFFLLSGACLFYWFFNVKRTLAYYALFFCCCIGFMCKETYALSTLLLASFYFFYHRKDSVKKAIIPFLLVAGSFVLVLIFNVFTRSIFVNIGGNTRTDPYFINLNPVSIFKEFRSYATEGVNTLQWVIVFVAGVITVVYFSKGERKTGFVVGGCIIAAFLSWLPNSVIPNHHHPGYSFNGAYLLYIPVVFIPLIRENELTIPYVPALLISISLVSPYFNRIEYARQWWTLEQEMTQRNLLHSLDVVMKQIAPAQNRHNILLTGLTMPFYPFHHPRSLKEYSSSGFAEFDVVNYSLTTDMPIEDNVKFVAPNTIKIDQYDKVWMFASNGKLVGNITLDQKAKELLIRNNYIDLIMHPDSTSVPKLLLLKEKGTN